MTNVATTPPPVGVGIPARERVPDPARERMRLLPTDDGWSLVGPDDELVFAARGRRGRRRCLAFARAHGVLRLTS